ncbi:MAG: hypothetical protein RRY07_07505 [Bacteroidaceae bacterium]
MKKEVLILLLLLTSFPTMQAQDSIAARKLAAYAKNINTFNGLFPQEKVYLHLDNTAYYKGETIWFKAYVVRTDSSVYTNLSRVLYVELVNPWGEVIEKRKLYIDNGQAHGDIALTKPMEGGFYEIRAYTRYMVNWGENALFSRVFPIFEKMPPKGEYTNKTHMELMSLGNHLSIYRGAAPRKKEEKHCEVAFYPEGGALVKGIAIRTAFEVNSKDTCQKGLVTGLLMNENNDTLQTITTIREGRGMFTYAPSEQKLKLAIIGENKELTFHPLPNPIDTGCVINVNTISDKEVKVQISGTTSLYGEVMGLTVMHNGNILYFDTISIYEQTRKIYYQKERLPPGVNQITLFDRNGRIHSERLFFIFPKIERDIDTIAFSRYDGKLRPFSKVRIEAKAKPETTFSLSVMDTEKTPLTNVQNAATWLLLSSDLKGFVRNPAYYFEADDVEHRSAVDLLMMVQGWRRYEWKIMAGIDSFIKKQPIEEKLYLDGRLESKNKNLPLKGVELKATLYSGPTSMSGKATTISKGRFGFDLPNCYGKWTLLLNTKLDGEAEKYKVTLNRQFSPPKRDISTHENFFSFRDVVVKKEKEEDDSIWIQPPPPVKTIVLGSAKVVKKKNDKQHTRRAWENEESVARLPSVYFNCEEIVEDLADKGETVPNAYEWLLKKDVFHHEEKEKERTSLWFVNNGKEFAFFTGESKNGIASCPYLLDDIRSMYVLPFMRVGKETGDLEIPRKRMWYGDLRIYIFTQHTTLKNIKGLRRTHFQGYNEPQTFKMNDYSVMPPEEDYRRTLYWTPNVTTDKEGKATIEFWNNSTCRQFIISAEGITKDGTPIVYRDK